MNTGKERIKHGNQNDERFQITSGFSNRSDTDEGKPIYKTKSYSNVAEDVTPDQLQQVGEALASLSTYPMGGIQQSLLHEVL